MLQAFAKIRWEQKKIADWYEGVRPLPFFLLTLEFFFSYEEWGKATSIN